MTIERAGFGLKYIEEPLACLVGFSCDLGHNLVSARFMKVSNEGH